MLLYQGKLNWFGYARNELFIIILPFGVARLNDPIHIYWQWTEDSTGSRKGNALCSSFISSVTETAIEGEGRFSCTHGDYYSFDIVSKKEREPHEKSELHVTMRSPQGERSSVMVLKAAYTDNDPNPAPLEKARPLIHVGKLNWYEYAINELFVVILPLGLRGGKPVGAFWQWTIRADGQRNCNAHIIRTQVCDTALANNFSFSDGYYTFNCEIDESSENLKVTMRNPAGDTVEQNPLPSLEIVNRSDHGDGERRKRALLDYTLEIKNDLNRVVMCTFSPSASSSAGKVLAAGGFWLALPGLIPTAVTTPPPLIGWLVTIAGAIAATTGLVDVNLASAEPTTRPMFPGDVTSNTSSGGIIHSANNISVLDLWVKGGNELVVRHGTALNVNRDVSWTLAVNAGNLAWANIIQLQLPRDQHIVSYRGMRIQNLQPAWGGKPASDIDPNASPTDYALSIEKGVKSTTYYDLKIPDQEIIFRVAPTYQFVVTQSLEQARMGRPTGDYNLLPLPNGHVLVRVNNCVVIGAFRSGGSRSDKASSEYDVKNLITRNSDGWAYTHDIGGRILMTWLRNEDASEAIKRQEGFSTYFLVPGIHVVTKQFLVDKL